MARRGGQDVLLPGPEKMAAEVFKAEVPNTSTKGSASSFVPNVDKV